MDTTEFFFIDDIYEISLGREPMTDFRFTVGKPREINGKKFTISSILQNYNSMVAQGTTRIEIYVKNDKDEEFLWKVSENQPIMITAKL
jgi:hypothetical protein